MNPRLDLTRPYPFERLRALLAGSSPPADRAHVNLSIGEPRHPTPKLVLDALASAGAGLSHYPMTIGPAPLREAIAAWLARRHGIATPDPATEVLPVLGSREALFAFAQATIDASRPGATVVMPNPFYQIYEGAALLAGAEPVFLNTTGGNRFQPDLDAVSAEVWKRCEILFLCSPGNPTGAVLSLEFLRHALKLAEKYDFVVASDECYADLYRDESTPPPSLLEAAVADGNTSFERCMVFHSLSKRSSVPGLRSGFVAGDARLIKPYLLYRTYHGCAMPVPTQLASIAAWNDDAHAAANRMLYREKYARVLPILQPVLDVVEPDGAFYLWPDIHGDDEAFTRDLYATQNLTILPGSYLARNTRAGNPGRQRVRISLVAPVEECVTAAQRIRTFLAK